MGLDVDIPDPPALWGPQQPGDYEAVEEIDDPQDDYRREELETFLEDGAWAEGFDEWAAHTPLDEGEFEVALEAGLFDKLDFYWEPATGDVGYRSPTVETVPADTRLGEDTPENIEEELDTLAHTVSARLEDYVDRDGAEFGFFADRE